MSDMMQDWLFTPAKGDGSGPLRAGPHYRNIEEGHREEQEIKGHRKRMEEKQYQLGMRRVDENRSGWASGKTCRMKSWCMIEWGGEDTSQSGKTWQTQHSQLNRHSSVSWQSQKKQSMRLKTMTLFLWSEMKAKRGKEGEGGQDKRNKDGLGRDGREWAVANRDGTNDTTFCVTTPSKKKKNTHTKTKQKPWTSKQFNWKCWVLQVCGWLGLLAMIYPRPNSSTFCIHYYVLLNPH